MAPEADSLLEHGMDLLDKDFTQSRLDILRSWASSVVHTTKKIQSPLFKRPNARLRPTAYLDGMRGFAALLVYFLHNQIWAHGSLHADQIMENGFGYKKQYYFACLPGVRLFFTGGVSGPCRLLKLRLPC